MPEPTRVEVIESEHAPELRPWFTVAVLTFGDHLPLLRRCLDSIHTTLPHDLSEVVVAANAPSAATRDWLEVRMKEGWIHRLLLSPENLLKIPMMDWVIRTARGDYLWWFDDDSHVTEREAFPRWWTQMEASSPRVVGWGATAFARDLDGFTDSNAAREWVRQARWFRGLEPPGGPGAEVDVWWFLTGGCWLMRLSALRAMAWPDPRLRHVSEDILMGEAVRQQGWHLANILNPGVAFSDAERRGSVHTATPLWD